MKLEQIWKSTNKRQELEIFRGSCLTSLNGKNGKKKKKNKGIVALAGSGSGSGSPTISPLSLQSYNPY